MKEELQENETSRLEALGFSLKIHSTPRLVVEDERFQIRFDSVDLYFKGKHILNTHYSFGVGHLPKLLDGGGCVNIRYTYPHPKIEGKELAKLYPVRFSNGATWQLCKNPHTQFVNPTCNALQDAYEGILAVVPSRWWSRKLDTAGLCYSVLIDLVDLQDDFSDWCGNFGYDDDSIKAQEIFQACVSQSRAVRKAVTPEAIEAAQEILQDY